MLMVSSACACPEISHLPALFIFVHPCLFRYCGHGSLPWTTSPLWRVPACSHAGQLHPIPLPFYPPATLCSSSNTKKESLPFIRMLSMEKGKCPKPCACFVSVSVLLSFFHDTCTRVRARLRCILIPLLYHTPGDRKEMRREPGRCTTDCFLPKMKKEEEKCFRSK